MATEFNSEQVITQVTANLQARFPDQSEERIRGIVTGEVDKLKGKAVTDYVAVLSEREAKKRLKNS